jgi:hypothetical protein
LAPVLLERTQLDPAMLALLESFRLGADIPGAVRVAENRIQAGDIEAESDQKLPHPSKFFPQGVQLGLDIEHRLAL